MLLLVNGFSIITTLVRVCEQVKRCYAGECFSLVALGEEVLVVCWSSCDADVSVEVLRINGES